MKESWLIPALTAATPIHTPSPTASRTLTPSAPASPTGPLGRYLQDPGGPSSRLTHQLTHRLDAVGAGALRLAPLLAGLLALAVGGLLVLRRVRARRLVAGARIVSILAPPQVEPGSAAALWSNLIALLRPAWSRRLLGQPHLSFELTASAAGLQIGLWVPGSVPPGMVERAVEAAWPGARTHTTPATPPLPATSRKTGGLATGGQLRLSGPECYPLRTEHPADPLRPLLGALADLGPRQAACVQILARPATGRRLRALRRAAATRRTGRPTTRTARILETFTPGATRRPAETDPQRAADVAAILVKAAQPCWAVAIRYAITTTSVSAVGASRAERAAARGQLRGRAHGIASSFALFSGRNGLTRRRLPHPTQVLAGRRLGRGDLLSVAELAAVAHLPGDLSVPGLVRAGARAVAAPPGLSDGTNPVDGSSGGQVADSSNVGGSGAGAAKLLGDSDSGTRRPVALGVVDARQHLHVLGATGSGKSTLLTNLILGDVAAGRGVVVIDPKGDLIVDLIDRLPAAAGARTVLLDPDDAGSPPTLNVLDGADPDLTVDNLVGIFRSIFERFWGPRTDDILRSACLTLLHHTRRTNAVHTIADVPKLLSDAAFRRAAIVGLDDPAGLGGFWDWYDGLGDSARAQVIGPLLNKLRAFLLRDFVRAVVGTTTSSFDMAKVLDGGICLVRIPKGVLGEETSRLLGSFVVARVWQAAAHRARTGQDTRVDAALYVDECQNFLTLPRSFEEMLAEARGYHLCLVLAHQHLGQLPRDLREAVSSNARNKIVFNVSPEDARALERHVSPELSAHDLSHLPAYTAAARLLLHGEQTPAFTLRTRPSDPANPARGEQVRAAARELNTRNSQHSEAAQLTGHGLPRATQPAPRPATGPSAGPAAGGSDGDSDRGSDAGSDRGSASHRTPLAAAKDQPTGPVGGSAATADSLGEWE